MTSDQKIRANLAKHNALTEKLVLQGVGREEASRQAFAAMRSRRSRPTAGKERDRTAQRLAEMDVYTR